MLWDQGVDWKHNGFEGVTCSDCCLLNTGILMLYFLLAAILWEKRDSPQQSFIVWIHLIFYYKYSSVVTKRSICHENTANKRFSAHKTGSYVECSYTGSERARQLIWSPLRYTTTQRREGERGHHYGTDRALWLVNSDPVPQSTSQHRV